MTFICSNRPGTSPESTIDIRRMNTRNKQRFVHRVCRNLAAFSLLIALITTVRLALLGVNLNDVDKSILLREGSSIDSPESILSRTADAGNMSDFVITVKTSQKFAETRLRLILDTWYQLAPEKIYFFTDRPPDGTVSSGANTNQSSQNALRSHIIETSCGDSHWRQALNCKMNAELDFFYSLQTQPSWLCHFDDDNYVNVPALGELLADTDASAPVYLGKPSTSGPVAVGGGGALNGAESKKFWFATGGAGVCLSKALMQLMQPLVQHGAFAQIGDKIRLPDDVTLGYIIESLLQVRLSVNDKFHSHLESLSLVKLGNLKKQISFGYAEYPRANYVHLPERFFRKSEDTARVRELHCYLYSNRFPDLCKLLPVR